MTEPKAKLIFITGGVRSGKSCYAQKMASTIAGQVFFIATCIPGDEEMEARVAEHRRYRPASWTTIEEGFNPARVIRCNDKPGAVFLVDCLTMLINNLMFCREDIEGDISILSRIDRLARMASAAEASVIIVSNEVGGGIVPADPLSRAYRDLLGRANQIVAHQADEVYLCIAGLAMELKNRAPAICPDRKEEI